MQAGAKTGLTGSSSTAVRRLSVPTSSKSCHSERSESLP